MSRHTAQDVSHPNAATFPPEPKPETDTRP